MMCAHSKGDNLDWTRWTLACPQCKLTVHTKACRTGKHFQPVTTRNLDFGEVGGMGRGSGFKRLVS